MSQVIFVNKETVGFNFKKMSFDLKLTQESMNHFFNDFISAD